MKCSVAMCTYNGEKFIEQQLLSIINQTVIPNEIIVCDDSKNNKTSKIIKNIAKKYPFVDIKIIKNNPSLGAVENFMKAFSLCKYEIVFGSDQDDIWETDKIKTIMNVFSKRKDINVIATNAILIDGEGKSLRETLKSTLDLKFEDSLVSIDELLNKYCVTGATMAYRKSFLDKNICSPKYWIHDGILAIIASLDDSLYFLDDCLTRYRLHGNNVCGVSRLNKRDFFYDLLKKPYYASDYYLDNYNRYKEAKKIAKDVKNKDNLIKLEDCISFWEYRTKLKSISFKTLIENIKQNKINNRYLKYTHNYKEVLLDYYIWFVLRVTKRRSER